MPVKKSVYKSRKVKGGSKPEGLTKDYNDKSAFDYLLADFKKRGDLVNAIKCFEEKGIDNEGNVIEKEDCDESAAHPTKGNPYIFIEKDDNKEIPIHSYTGINGPLNKPVFTNFIEDGNIIISGNTIKPNILHTVKDKNRYVEFVFILNDKAPYTELYHEKDKGLAGMSFVHFFAIPVQRIYNPVTLNSSHIPLLNRMRDEAKKYIDNFDNRQKLFHKISEISTIQANKTNTLADQSINDRFNNHKQLLFDQNIKFSDKLEFYFHVHPFPSVGHLHMHCILGGDFRTSHEHDWKNMPLDAVLNSIKDIEPPSQSGGKKKKILTKTDEKIKVGNRNAVVYVTKRGAKHVKMKGEYVHIRDINKKLKQQKI